MGPLIIVIVAAIAAFLVGRAIGEAGPRDRYMRLGGAIVLAFIGAWLVGSATQAASFMMSSPGWQTLLGGLVGGLLGGFAGSVYARRRPAE